MNDPKLSSRAVREYLEALDEEALAEALPKKISLTDPQSRWTAAPWPGLFAYSTNYLIDTEHGVIMDVEATPAHRTAEVDSTRTMVERVEAQFDLTPERLIGDTAYGTAPMLARMVEEKTSNRMCRCGTRPSARTTASPVTTFTGVRTPMNIAAQPANRYAVNGAPSPSKGRG